MLLRIVILSANNNKGNNLRKGQTEIFSSSVWTCTKCVRSSSNPDHWLVDLVANSLALPSVNGTKDVPRFFLSAGECSGIVACGTIMEVPRFLLRDSGEGVAPAKKGPRVPAPPLLFPCSSATIFCTVCLSIPSSCTRKSCISNNSSFRSAA